MDGLKNLNLLFLEDNEEFAKNTGEFLNLYFKSVYHALTIKEAMELFHDKKIDVIISDIKLKDANGLAFVKSIRELDEKIPIVILSAHKDEEFLLSAIPLNITSYEVKPLSYGKFMALLHTIAQKFQNKHRVNLHSNVQYNFKDKTLLVDNKSLKLTKKEILFIELMIKNNDEVVTNDMIQRSVWQDKFMSDSAIKNLIFRLRKKVGEDFIETIQCVGYKLKR